MKKLITLITMIMLSLTFSCNKPVPPNPIEFQIPETVELVGNSYDEYVINHGAAGDLHREYRWEFIDASTCYRTPYDSDGVNLLTELGKEVSYYYVEPTSIAGASSGIRFTKAQYDQNTDPCEGLDHIHYCAWSLFWQSIPEANSKELKCKYSIGSCDKEYSVYYTYKWVKLN